jgi:hypothetical protein
MRGNVKLGKECCEIRQNLRQVTSHHRAYGGKLATLLNVSGRFDFVVGNGIAGRFRRLKTGSVRERVK